MRIPSFAAAVLVIIPAIAQTPQDAIADALKAVEAERIAADQAARQAERYSTLTAAGITVTSPASAATVKNAPYSADAITESTQILGDGNRIVQRTTQKLYRDNDGRERREESMFDIGALAQPNSPRTITISDPVENVSYTLDPEQRTARRGPGARIFRAVSDLTLRVNWAGGITIGNSAPESAGEPLKEDLGSKTIEGVTAHGTRTTHTIPAGQIGNLLPINVVDEVWYSPDLQMNVLTTHNDPRSGETTYKLINISRANPARSLFEPPPDYTVTGGGRGGVRGPGPAPAAAPGGRRGPAPTN